MAPVGGGVRNGDGRTAETKLEGIDFDGHVGDRVVYVVWWFLGNSKSDLDFAMGRREVLPGDYWPSLNLVCSVGGK